MGIIKLGLISIVVFALMITGISFFFPSHVRISKAIEISADKQTIIDQLKDTARWKKWYPGIDSIQHPPVVLEVTDTTVTAGNTGTSEKRGNMGWNVFEGGIPHSFTVQWYMDFHLHWYPWEKFSSLLLEKRYGPMMEKGLDNLKKQLEQH